MTEDEVRAGVHVYWKTISRQYHSQEGQKGHASGQRSRNSSKVLQRSKNVSLAHCDRQVCSDILQHHQSLVSAIRSSPLEECRDATWLRAAFLDNPPFFQLFAQGECHEIDLPDLVGEEMEEELDDALDSFQAYQRLYSGKLDGCEGWFLAKELSWLSPTVSVRHSIGLLSEISSAASRSLDAASECERTRKAQPICSSLGVSRAV